MGRAIWIPQCCKLGKLLLEIKKYRLCCSLCTFQASEPVTSNSGSDPNPQSDSNVLLQGTLNWLWSLMPIPPCDLLNKWDYLREDWWFLYSSFFYLCVWPRLLIRTTQHHSVVKSSITNTTRWVTFSKQRQQNHLVRLRLRKRLWFCGK